MLTVQLLVELRLMDFGCVGERCTQVKALDLVHVPLLCF